MLFSDMPMGEEKYYIYTDASNMDPVSYTHLMQYTNLWMEESAKKILIKSKINLMKRSNYIRIFLHISMKSEH